MCKRRPRRLWLDDRHFQRRVLDPALTEARLCGHTAAGPDATHRRCWDGGCDSRRHRVRKGSPNDARHTAASQLVIDGTSLYKVQKLLGHESPLTTQRYAHLQPDEYDDFRDVWRDSTKDETRGTCPRARGTARRDARSVRTMFEFAVGHVLAHGRRIRRRSGLALAHVWRMSIKKDPP